MRPWCIVNSRSAASYCSSVIVVICNSPPFMTSCGSGGPLMHRGRRGHRPGLLMGWKLETVRQHGVVGAHVACHRGSRAAREHVGQGEPHTADVGLHHPLAPELPVPEMVCPDDDKAAAECQRASRKFPVPSR